MDSTNYKLKIFEKDLLLTEHAKRVFVCFFFFLLLLLLLLPKQYGITALFSIYIVLGRISILEMIDHIREYVCRVYTNDAP